MVAPILVAVAGTVTGFLSGKGGSSGQADKSPSIGSGGLIEIASKKDLTTNYLNKQTTYSPTSVYAPTRTETITYSPQSTNIYQIDSPYASLSASPSIVPYTSSVTTPNFNVTPNINPIQDYNASPKTAQESTIAGILPYILIGGAVWYLFIRK